MIKVRLFASLRERIGIAELAYTYAGEKCVSDLMHALQDNNHEWSIIHENDVLVAVNQTLCGKDQAINDGDEVAFFPPVTGG